DAIHGGEAVTDALAALARPLEPLRLLAVRRRLARHEAEAAEDDGERIVDLVRSGAREQGDRAKLCGVAARHFRGAPGHDVTEQPRDETDAHEVEDEHWQPHRREQCGAALAEPEERGPRPDIHGDAEGHGLPETPPPTTP